MFDADFLRTISIFFFTNLSQSTAHFALQIASSKQSQIASFSSIFQPIVYWH